MRLLEQKEPIESLPLLDIGETAKIPIETETVEEDDAFFDKEFIEVKPKNRISLWLVDYMMLLVLHSQIFVMLFILSLNLKTAWSYAFTMNFAGLFWINLDFWSWYKVAVKPTTINDDGTTTNISIWPTATTYSLVEYIPINYLQLSYIYVALVILASITYLVIHILIKYKFPEKRLELGGFILMGVSLFAEACYIPFGVFCLRWWWCRYEGSDLITPNKLNNETDVYPSASCFDIHNHEIVVCQILTLVIWVGWLALPCFLYSKIRRNVITDKVMEHEAFILLRETEYVYGLSNDWIHSRFYFMSSYRRPWAYFRVYMFAIRTVLLVIYGAMFDYERAQHLVLTFFLFLICIVMIVRRPHRLISFNLMLFMSFFVNFWNAFIGVCVEMETQNALTQELYLKYELVLLNGGFYLLMLAWLIYLLLRWKKIIRKDLPLWPNLTKSSSIKEDIDGLTRRYLVAIIRCQFLLKETYSTPALLAPAHELSRRIKIVNAYSREARYFDHVLKHTLWDVTEELIQAHTSVFKKSIFSTSSAFGSRESAKQLYIMLPELARRLRQRDQDLTLVSAKRRRILLKMYTLSVFLEKHLVRIRKELAMERERKVYDSDSDFEVEETLIMNGDVSDDEASQEYLGAGNTPLIVMEDDKHSFSTDMDIFPSPLDTTQENDDISQSLTPIRDRQSFEAEVSDLLNNSIFDKAGPGVGHNNKRMSFGGVTEKSSLLSPQAERPGTSPHRYTNRNKEVLSFKKHKDFDV